MFLLHHLIVPHRMDQVCGAYFSQEEQLVTMELKGINKILQQLSNKAKQESWQKIANCVNLLRIYFTTQWILNTPHLFLAK